MAEKKIKEPSKEELLEEEFKEIVANKKPSVAAQREPAKGGGVIL